MTLSLGTYIFIVVAISFIIKGLVGFGDPLIFNPLLSIRMDNKHISPGLLPVSLLLNAVIVYRSRNSIHPSKLLPICFWMVLGVIPGTLLLINSRAFTVFSSPIWSLGQINAVYLLIYKSRACLVSLTLRMAPQGQLSLLTPCPITIFSLLTSYVTGFSFSDAAACFLAFV